MKIPKSFKLMGLKITVEFKDDLASEEGFDGLAKYITQEILLQPSLKGRIIPNEGIEQSFIHELVHHILHSMESKLRSDESFVNLFASLLHQALATMEYDK